MKTVMIWLPKEVSNKMTEEKFNQLQVISYGKTDNSFKESLNEEQIEKLYKGALNGYFVNGEFICYY